MALFKISGSVVKKITLKKSLKELEEQKLLKFQKSFGAWSLSSYDDPTNDINKLFLKKIDVINTGDLKLIVETEAKNEQFNYIRSDNKDLLKEIKDILETMIGKKLSEVYHEKIIIYG